MWRGVSGLARPPPSEAKRGYCSHVLIMEIREISKFDNGGKTGSNVSAHKFGRRRRPLSFPAMARLVLVAVVLSLLLGVEGGKRGGKGKPGKVAGALPISSKPKSVAGSPARAPEIPAEALAGSEHGEPRRAPAGSPRKVATRSTVEARKTNAANRAAVAASRLRSTASQVSLCTTGPPCTLFLTGAFLCRALPARPWDLPRLRQQLRRHQLSATSPHPVFR